MTALSRAVLGTLAAGLAWAPGAAVAQTAFTYQGRLTDAGNPVEGTYDFRLILYGAAVGGGQVGPIVVSEDVAVAQGLFTVQVDFGAVFTGDARWLEIGVRPGASTGAFTTLPSRQELTPSPAALFSPRAPWTGVTAKPAGFADDVDGDILAGLSCASGQLAKWNRIAWACAADLDTNSGGTVTSVATGTALTGGPVTSSGTVSVAPGGITSGLFANGAVGLAQINQAQVQARVSGLCPMRQYVTGINPDGTVTCGLYLIPNVITTVDGPGFVGVETSIAIGADGLPVISYFDFGAGDLKVAHCGNAACSAGNTITTVDAPGTVGQYTSIAIGADGLPVISYDAAGDLKVAHCGNAACSAGNAITTVDAPGAVGFYTSIAIGADGLPVISYFDGTARDLKVAHCGNAACSAGNTITTVETNGFVGYHTSIAIGSDGLPVISYYGIPDNGALRVAHCGNAACSAGNTITTVDAPGEDTSIAIGADGLPVISYRGGGGADVKVAHCGNAACSAGNTITTVDAPGYDTSIAIGSDGLPIISYYDGTALALKVAHCGNAACTAGNVVVAVDDHANNVGWYTSIAIGADGFPVISYYDSTAQALKVAKCTTRTCQ